MKKFLVKLFILLGIIGITLLLIIVVPPGKTYQKSLLYAKIDKDSLLKNVPSPRIIFVGGSNLSFGLNSQRILDSIELHPINTSIQGGIGLEFMLANVENYIKEDDIVIIAPEYHQFYGNMSKGEGELLTTIFDVSKESIKLLKPSQIVPLVHYFPVYSQNKIKSWLKNNTDTTIGVYDRKSFNAFGDACIHWNLKKIEVPPYGEIKDEFNNNLIDVLKSFNKSLIAKKSKLYIVFPCYQSASFENAYKQIYKVKEELNKSGLTILSEPERYKFNDNFIFNTPYHLTKEGLELRTSYLIEDLRKIGF